MLAPRISIDRLAGLCRRLAISLEAGMDLRSVWKREVDRAAGYARKMFQVVRDAVDRGESLQQALSATATFFPALFRELVAVGERTGHLPEAFTQLADHYDEQLRLRRTFLSGLAWPLVQLAAAIAIVGLLIWVMGVIQPPGGPAIDPLGWGLVGNQGLAIYVFLVGGVALVLGVLIWATLRGVFWTQPIQRLALDVPLVGPVLRTMALARLAWALGLTLGAGIDLRRALEISLRSTQNARYIDHVHPMQVQVSAGNSLYEAFVQTHAYPEDFLDAVRVGEQTGMLAESLVRLSGQYRQRAEAATHSLAMLGAFGVWALVAAFIVTLIFRMYSFYLGMIRDALPP